MVSIIYMSASIYKNGKALPLKKKLIRTLNNYDYSYNAIKLPNWSKYITEIKLLVTDNWDLPDLGKACLYNSDTPANDLFRTDQISTDPNISHVKFTNQICSTKRYLNKRDLLELTTEFNTINFFANVKTRINFLYIVITSFREAFVEIQQKLQLTRNNLNFILKGGVIFRLFILELIRGFVKEVQDYIIEQICDKIKLSDFDFEIISNKITKEHFNKINMISYLIILKIRNYIEEHYLLDFFQLSDQFKCLKLEQLKKTIIDKIATLNEDHLYYGITVDRIEINPQIGSGALVGNRTEYQPYCGAKTVKKKDFAIIVNARQRSPKYKDAEDDVNSNNNITLISAANLFHLYGMDQKYIDLARNNSYLYALFNPLIIMEKELADDDDVMSFQLNRIKYNYILFFQKNGKKYMESIPGEVLDFSHASLNDRKRVKYTVPFYRNIYFANYKLYQYNISFMTYSHYGVIIDLLEILFIENNFQPWLNHKYKKRLYRLIYMIVLSYMSMPKSINDFGVNYRIAEKQLYHNKIVELKQLLKMIKLANSQPTLAESAFTYKVRDALLLQLFESIQGTIANKDDPDFEEFYQITIKILQKLILLIEINHQKAEQFKLSDNPLSTLGLQ